MSSFIPAIATRRHPAPRASRATKKTKQSFLHNHLVSPSCDPGGARTHDPLIKNQLLCQLSYGVNGAFISELRLQRYDFFLNYQHYSRFFSKKSHFLVLASRIALPQRVLQRAIKPGGEARCRKWAFFVPDIKKQATCCINI